MKPYDKPWLSIPDQLQKLKDYGLTIADEPGAHAFLQHINYYRFSGYGLAFEQARHVFLAGTTFEQIRNAYEFDRSLRDLVTESLEVIELDLRTTIAYSFGRKHGPFGYIHAGSFFNTFHHQEWLKKLHQETTRSSELFVKHYEMKYQEFPNLPIWVATEIMSFGALSKMYHGMIRQDQKEIAARYHLQPDTLGSWFHHLVYIRNLGAHHARLWDRVWTIKPHLPAGKGWLPPFLASNARLFATLLIQNALLRHCPAEQPFTRVWRSRLEALLLDNVPAIPNALDQMDLPEEWQHHPLWG